MQGEELLRALGKVAKEQASAEPAELTGVADFGRRPESYSDEQLSAALAPASPERLDALTALSLRALSRGTETPSATKRHASAPKCEPGAKRVRWTSTRLGRTVFALGGAAALSLVVLSLRTSSDALPAYGLELKERSAEMRGESETSVDAKPLLVETGASLEVVLRPRTAHGLPVAARVFFTSAGGESLWPATAEVAPSGAIRLSGIVPAPAGWVAAGTPSAAGEVVAIVARPDRLPLHASDAKASEGVLVIRRPVVWR